MTISAHEAHIDISDSTFFLKGHLDFDSVIVLLSQADASIAKMQDCRIDMTEVTYSNSAGVAFLLHLLRTAAKYKIPLSISSIPQNLQDLIKLSGVDELLTVSTQ